MSATSLSLGSAAIAVGCCAGLPLLAAAVGGLTGAALLGLAGLGVAVGLLAFGLVIRSRRAACAPKAPGVEG